MVFAMSEWLLDAEVVQLGLASALNQVAALLAQARAGERGPALEDPSALTLVRRPRQAFLARSEGAALGRRHPPLRGARVDRADDAPPGRPRAPVRAPAADRRARPHQHLARGGRDGGHRRFAGLAGLAELAEIAQPFLAYPPQQDRRSFVDAVDFVVADPVAMHGAGEDRAGRGILVTDLAVFEFASGGARALSVHAGVDAAALRERTPAAVTLDGAPRTPPPDPALLRRLRTAIDPRRVRDIEFASGAARREALLRLHAAEAACTLP